MQGQLRKEHLTIQIETECAHCKRPLHLEIDDQMNCRTLEEGAQPVVFIPLVDFRKLEDPSIIDAF